MFPRIFMEEALVRILWRLCSVRLLGTSENPSKYFYEAIGVRKISERDERLWGESIPQIAYAWDVSKDGFTVQKPHR